MNKNGKKDFKNWMGLKERIHYAKSVRTIREGELWWSSIGENVGSEICGKGTAFLRPVLIFKKLDKYSFLAIPLTSKEHHGSWYVPFEFNGRQQNAIVAQIEYMSVFRLQRKMGQLPDSDYQNIRNGFIALI